MIEDRIWLLSPSKPTITYEHTYSPSNSPPRLIQWTDRAMFDAEGKVIEYQSVGRDVTARKAMEEELVKSQRLESVGVLAGGIAHDFNNIMTAILGNVALAKTWCRPGDRVMEKLIETEKATLRARDLTQQLLTFSKGGPPIRQAASISEVLHDTIDFSLSGSNILPHYVLPADLWR